MRKKKAKSTVQKPRRLGMNEMIESIMVSARRRKKDRLDPKDLAPSILEATEKAGYLFGKDEKGYIVPESIAPAIGFIEALQYMTSGAIPYTDWDQIDSDLTDWFVPYDYFRGRDGGQTSLFALWAYEQGLIGLSNGAVYGGQPWADCLIGGRAAEWASMRYEIGDPSKTPLAACNKVHPTNKHTWLYRINTAAEYEGRTLVDFAKL